MIPYITEVQPGVVYTVSKLPTERQVRALSAMKPGTFYLTATSLQWVSGKSKQFFLLADEKEDIEKARVVTQSIIQADTGWTYARMARDITQWLDIRQQPLKRVVSLVPEKWHFQQCSAYETDDARLYDLKSAYWQFVCRCGSPVFDIYRGRVQFGTITREQSKRWDFVREVFQSGASKPLRLALVGVNAAGWDRGITDKIAGSVRYCKGKAIPNEVPAGPLQPVAILSVRCTFEVVQIQSGLSEAIYSNADSIMTEQRRTPEYWDALKLVYELKAEGRAFVNSMGAWKVGKRQTRLFRPDARWIKDHAATPLTDVTWHKQICT